MVASCGPIHVVFDGGFGLDTLVVAGGSGVLGRVSDWEVAHYFLLIVDRFGFELQVTVLESNLVLLVWRAYEGNFQNTYITAVWFGFWQHVAVADAFVANFVVDVLPPPNHPEVEILEHVVEL